MYNLAGNKIKEKYKDLLHTSNNNTGIDATLKNIKCGDGDSTSLYLSNKSLTVNPLADNTTVFEVKNLTGQSLFSVDSTNSTIKSGVGAHVVNTQIKSFGAFDMQGNNGYHNALICNSCMVSDGGASWTGQTNGSDWGGNGAEPVTSLTLASAAEQLLPCLWVLQSNITIQAVQYILCAEASTAFQIHVMSYDIQSGSGATAGDLSSGAILSHTPSGSSVTVGDDRISIGTLTNLITDVNSGKAIVVFIEDDGQSRDFSAQINIKYNLR